MYLYNVQSYDTTSIRRRWMTSTLNHQYVYGFGELNGTSILFNFVAASGEVIKLISNPSTTFNIQKTAEDGKFYLDITLSAWSYLTLISTCPLE